MTHLSDRALHSFNITQVRLCSDGAGSGREGGCLKSSPYRFMSSLLKTGKLSTHMILCNFLW